MATFLHIREALTSLKKDEQLVVRLAPDGTFEFAKERYGPQVATKGEILSVARIVDTAKKAVSAKGYVEYADYDADLLAEVVNGSVQPSQLGWRLQWIRNVLLANQWNPQGRPVRFYPPR